MFDWNRVLVVLIVLGLVLSGLAYAEKQRAQSDKSGTVRFLSAYDVITISADTAIAKGILGISPETDVIVYFGTDTTNDFQLNAGDIFGVHQSYDVKLKTETVCLVF